MCRIRERALLNQLEINAKKIEAFEQKLLSLYSRFHKMRHDQAQLQAELHEEMRERLTTEVKTRKPRTPKTPKVFTIEEALVRLGWSAENIANALATNPGWKTKEVRV